MIIHKFLAYAGMLMLSASVAPKSNVAPRPAKAGEGQDQPMVLKLAGAPDDGQQFSKDTDYVTVYVSSWWINDASNFFKNKMASGTVDLKLGAEDYPFTLGTYELSGGNKISPVFNVPVLDHRAYNGGDLQINAALYSTAKNTSLGGILTNIAASSLSILNGTVGTATQDGLSTPLGAASQTLFSGVQNLLASGPNAKPLLETNGMGATITASQLEGQDTFFLAYRGDPLAINTVTIVPVNNVYYKPQVNGQDLTSGAWILFHIVRSRTYGVKRPWEDAAIMAESDLDDIMQNWKAGIITQADAATAVTPTGKTNSDVADELISAIDQVNADGVLTPAEIRIWKNKLYTRLDLARTAVQTASGFDTYFQQESDLEASIRTGVPPASHTVEAAFVRADGLPDNAAVSDPPPAAEGMETPAPSKDYWKNLSLVQQSQGVPQADF